MRLAVLDADGDDVAAGRHAAPVVERRPRRTPDEGPAVQSDHDGQLRGHGRVVRRPAVENEAVLVFNGWGPPSQESPG